ncbi:MAG: di-trans,poly-cis-decaprenylcistransferase [Gammaproteobacteria bacterium]|nr:di-trans,poly-cis-decaprenylcistransferase [Gammaproteobacteria bacterium]
MAKKLQQLDSSLTVLPAHVAIVMDGNGRWAKKRLMPRAAGHKAGVGTLKKIVETASRSDVACLTVFAFSSENWNRPKKEVSILMDLFVSSINKHLSDLEKAGVCIRFIGDRSAFSEKLNNSLLLAEESTKNNTRLKFNIAMNYGGQWDIVNAAKEIVAEVQTGSLAADEIDENLFSKYVSLSDLPAVDLFIRTGGEHRISNFLLWQCAYSELYFTDVLWPDFSDEEFIKSLQWFSGRQRRFGRTGEQLEENLTSDDLKTNSKGAIK